MKEREREMADQKRLEWRHPCRDFEAAFQSCLERWSLHQKALRDQICISPTYRSKFPEQTQKGKKGITCNEIRKQREEVGKRERY